MKQKYCIIWVEGFEYFGGEKVKSFEADGIRYTTYMTRALRIRKEDIEKAKDKLRAYRIADWVIDSVNTFVPTSYAPKGTVFDFK